MIRIPNIIKNVFAIWGAVSFLAILLIGGYVGYKIGPGNTDRTNKATAKDVRFVLNWCELGEKRFKNIIHSFESSRSLTGDHYNAYELRISHVDLGVLKKTDDMSTQWIRGDKVSPVLKDAISLVSTFRNDQTKKWFPATQELLSKKFYVYAWRTVLHGAQTTSAQLIFIRPADDTVFYASVKT